MMDNLDFENVSLDFTLTDLPQAEGLVLVVIPIRGLMMLALHVESCTSIIHRSNFSNVHDFALTHLTWAGSLAQFVFIFKYK